MSSPVRPSAAPLAAAGGPPLEPFLTLLAKAIQKHRNYAASNTLCARATEACHQALVALDEDEIVLRVTPTALLLPDNTRAGESAPVQAELTRRLHRASVGTISFARGASLREVERFCRAMAAYGSAGDAAESLGDVLQRQGIGHIQVTTLSTPAVLAVGAPDAARLACVIDQQAWHQADIAVRGAGGHLYAPNKGWIRVDPSCPLRTVSLGDLALLADDPMKLASLLVQLSDEAGASTPEDALEGQLEQISHILRSLNPAFVEPMFARLAGTLLSLDESRRRRLLTSVLLPGLLDGRLDGALLRQLPDSEIAAALDAFGEVQTTAPALVVFALDRLSLDANRRSRIESLLHAGEKDGAGDTDGAAPGRIGGYADGRIYVEAGAGKSFDEFSTFDVSMGAEAVEAIEAMRAGAAEGRPEDEQIRCVLNLVRLESNPDTAAALLAQADPLCRALRESGEWTVFAFWIGRLRQLEASLAPDRPEVAARIGAMTAGYADPALINALVDMSADDRGRQHAAAVLEALGSAAAAPAAAVLEQETARGRRRSLLQLLSLRAAALAPGLVPLLESPQWFTVRNVLYLLGHAGAGYEGAAAARLTHKDVRVAREAARALAQIGTRQAVTHVTSAFLAPRDTARLAVEALARFPSDVARSGAKAFLSQPDLVVRNPWIARRLLDIVAASDTADLRPVLEPLARLRLRFWSPGAMRVGFKAAALMRRA